MTTAVFPARWGYGIKHPLDRAISNEAGSDHSSRRFPRAVTRSVSVEQAYADCVESLIEVFKEASQANWDGYDANKVSGATLTQAATLLAFLPSTFPKPEFSAHPDGELAFEWYFGPRRLLTVSVNESGRLSYAALIGQARHHGTEFLHDALPETIALVLRRIHSNWSR